MQRSILMFKYYQIKYYLNYINYGTRIIFSQNNWRLCSIDNKIARINIYLCWWLRKIA